MQTAHLSLETRLFLYIEAIAKDTYVRLLD